MASLAGVSLDPEVQEASDGFEVLPQGKYKMVIIGDELKTTKAGTGKYLAVKLQIVEGAHTTKQVTDNINLVNPSQVCQQIGQGTLKKICTLCGVLYPPQDTTGLYGKPMEVSIAVEKFTNKKTGKELPCNAVKSYSKVGVPVVTPTTAGAVEDAPW